MALPHTLQAQVLTPLFGFQEAISYLASPVSTEEERVAAAEALEVLVEPIDNAKGVMQLFEIRW